jgi:hypothetical protein
MASRVANGEKMMDGGWVVVGTVVGAAIGSVGSIATTWLQARLSRKEPDPFDAAATDLLKSMLSGDHKWRDIETLANVVGLDTKTTKEFLVILGARGSQKDGKMWGLVSRNPIEEAED